MTDISGIWVAVNPGFKPGFEPVYVITQVRNKFVWKLMTKHGEQTGIGELTGTDKDIVEVIYDCPSGADKGHIQIVNGSKIIVWNDGDVFKRP